MNDRKLKVLDLFSGIGGFSLGLERTGGFETVAFCEIDPYCQAVLGKHWPGVPIFDDVRELTGDAIGPTDIICGGFPCQDISQTGSGAGIEGARSGLWSEYSRLIGEIRPRYVLVENVSMLLGRGLDRVLGDLAEVRYDAEWHCIPAAAVGAPHIRDRLWIVAYPQHSNANGERSHRAQEHDGCVKSVDEQGCFSRSLGEILADTNSFGELQPQECEREQWGRSSYGGWWKTEPDVGRVADAVPARVDRIRALGNAVVPQIPEIIGRAILKAEGIEMTSGNGASNDGGENG